MRGAAMEARHTFVRVTNRAVSIVFIAGAVDKPLPSTVGPGRPSVAPEGGVGRPAPSRADPRPAEDDQRPALKSKRWPDGDGFGRN